MSGTQERDDRAVEKPTTTLSAEDLSATARELVALLERSTKQT